MKKLLSARGIISLLIAVAVFAAAFGKPSVVSAQSSCGATYTVQRGDYLMKIARACGVTYADLLEANPQIIHPSVIYAGTVLYIPVRIAFAAGGTSAVDSGHLAANSKQVYLINIGAGYTLETTYSALNSLTLAIRGADGNVVQAATSNMGFRGVMPKSQDYLVTLASGAATDYSLSVDIPVRIRFATGATSATLTGTVPAILSQYFILNAVKGQTLTVTATPDANLQLIIYGVDGTVMRSGMGQGASFTGTLPVSEDYILALRSAGGAQAFTLKVSIPATTPVPVSNTGSYTVQRGDTLYSIAVRYHTTVSILLRANPTITNRNVINVGQVIYLPGATITLSNGDILYIAKPGDYMMAIANQFNVTLSNLIAANPKITNPNLIYAGQRINIP